jgi:hypothetical protein
MAGMSGWYYLLLGGLLEIVWAISIKARPWWTLPQHWSGSSQRILPARCLGNDAGWHRLRCLDRDWWCGVRACRHLPL